MLLYAILDRGDRASAVRIFNVLTSDCSDIVYEMPRLFSRWEDGFVNQLTLRIQLARKHALAAKALECVVKPADTCKKIDELEL